MAATRTIALVIGSLRKDSYTRKVALAVRDLAPDSLRFTEIEIGNLPFYNQDLDPDRPPREWVAFRDQVRPVDGVLFATPEYNRSVPGVLKNAIDVGSRPYGKSAWDGKPAAVISVSPGTYGGFGANHHLRQSLVFLGMPCMAQPEAYIASVTKSLDADGKPNEKLRDLLSGFITAFADWVERFASARAHDTAA